MNVRGRWSRPLALTVLIVVVCGVPAIRGSILRAVGWVLVVDQPVGPADMIVVPEWAGAAGAIEASDLFHRGLAHRVGLQLEKLLLDVARHPFS
jgi:hypothetical protein